MWLRNHRVMLHKGQNFLSSESSGISHSLLSIFVLHSHLRAIMVHGDSFPLKVLHRTYARPLLLEKKNDSSFSCCCHTLGYQKAGPVEVSGASDRPYRSK
ncbi:hypothetical protein K1719_015760 [Acacia pycnantha]|nr:hypothetical protein K1719_015760 [Acacia pycnantha]